MQALSTSCAVVPSQRGKPHVLLFCCMSLYKPPKPSWLPGWGVWPDAGVRGSPGIAQKSPIPSVIAALASTECIIDARENLACAACAASSRGFQPDSSGTIWSRV